MELDELKRLEREATPGPWRMIPDSDYLVFGPHSLKSPVAAGADGLSNATVGEMLAARSSNAALIAATRNALPALIECAEALKDLCGFDTPLTQDKWDAARAALAALKEAGNG